MRRRHNFGGILWTLAVAAVAALLIALIVETRILVIARIDVYGAGDAVAEVTRMSGIRLGQRLRTVDEDQVRSAVESDGRFAFVGLEKDYPNIVRLAVRYRTEDAMISQGGKILVLDSDAYVISVSDNLPQKSLPYVTGLRPSGYMLGRQLDTGDGRCAAMKTVLEAVRTNNAWRYVSELNVADPDKMTITSRTGIIVQLGDQRNMNNKILWMVGALADLESRGEVTGQLDVSSGIMADYRPAAAPSQPETGAGIGQGFGS